MPTPGPRTSAATRRRVERSAGELSTAAIRRMETNHDWYRAAVRGGPLVGRAGRPGRHRAPSSRGTATRWAARTITADVFGTAPRELTRSVSLQQTLDLVRIVVDVVEDAGRRPGRARRGAGGCARRCCATPARSPSRPPRSTPQAAEARGAWDARLEALVVDAVLRGEADDALQSRAAALGWGTVTPRRRGRRDRRRRAARPAVVDALRRAAARLRRRRRWPPSRAAGWSCILGGVEDAGSTAHGAGRRTSATGPSWSGPTVPHLFAAGRSARAALSGLLRRAGLARRAPPGAGRRPAPRAGARRRRAARAAAGRPHLPPAGGRRRRRCSRPRRPTSTAAAALEAHGPGLFVHPNTVRYRLGRIADVTGYDLTHPREAHIVRIALAVGRLGPAAAPGRRRRRPADAAVTGPTSPLCRNPPNRRQDCWCRSVTTRSRRSREGWRRARHRLPRTGLPDPRLPRPLARAARRRATAWAGSPTSPASTSSPTAPTSDAETIKDTAVAQPLIVAAGLVAVLGALRATRPTARPASARRPGTPSARSPPPPSPACSRAEQAMALRPRARPGHGRGQRRRPRPA